MDIIKHVRLYMYKKAVIKYFIIAVIAGSIIVAGINNVNAEEIIEPEKTSGIRVNNLVFTVNSVSGSKSNQFKTASEGNKLVCINLEVTNDGTRQEQLTSIMIFKLYDNSGNIYNIVLPEGSDSINGLLSPGESKKGTVWFEVPKEANRFELCIRPSMMSQETGIIDIEIVENPNKNKEQIIEKRDLDPPNNIIIDNIVFNIK